MFVTFISWLPNHGATYFGQSSQVKGGCWLPLVPLNYYRIPQQTGTASHIVC